MNEVVMAGEKEVKRALADLTTEADHSPFMKRSQV